MIYDIFSSLFVTTLMIMLLTVFKHFFGKAMPAAWKYRLGYLFFLILILPAIPCAGAGAGMGAGEMVIDTVVSAGGLTYASEAEKTGTIVSLAENKEMLLSGRAQLILLTLWAVGALTVILVFVFSSLRLRNLRKTSSEAGERAQKIFASCLKELGIDGRISLRTGKVSSPMVFGLTSACVIIPDENIPDGDLRHILLHELIHYKRGDVAVNYAVCLFEAVYWFDPFVWIAFRGFKNDMEAACDEAVMERTGDGYGYGMTIIRFAGKGGHVPAAEMGGARKQIIKRVRAAAGFKKATVKQKMMSAGIFVLMAAAVISSLPAVSVNAYDRYEDGAGRNMTVEDLSEYFNGTDGCFVLYDAGSDAYTVYNEEMSLKRVSPDSTYKIFSAVSALESGIITPENNVLEWDGALNPFEQWDGDQDLDSAMANSVNWYFDRLNSENPQKLQMTLDKVGYGNGDMSGGEDFWMEDSLKISAMEQVDALRKLYFNECGFEDENVQAVKDAMEISEGLYGKTGTGMINGRETNGWFVGFAEKDGNVWIFALNMNDSDGASGTKAAETAVEILRDRGII